MRGEAKQTKKKKNEEREQGKGKKCSYWKLKKEIQCKFLWDKHDNYYTVETV